MSNLGKPIIDVSADHVVIMGTRIPRPPTIAPSQWLAFWERAKQGPGGESGQAVDAEDALG